MTEAGAGAGGVTGAGAGPGTGAGAGHTVWLGILEAGDLDIDINRRGLWGFVARGESNNRVVWGLFAIGVGFSAGVGVGTVNFRGLRAVALGWVGGAVFV